MKNTGLKHAKFEERQAIRLASARLFEQDCYPVSEVGRILGVSGPIIFEWHRLWKERGIEGLKIGTPGPKSKITDEVLHDIEQELEKGAREHGYDTDIWTLDRIADIVEKVTGVRYHTSYIWIILKKMDWSCQKPEKQSKQRDEEVIEKWKAQRWPVIKKGHKSKEPL